MEPSVKNWVSLLALGVIWGSSFLAVSIAVQNVGPLTVAAGRISIGAVLLLIFLRVRATPLPKLRTPGSTTVWAAAFGFGVCAMAFPFFFLSWGQQHVASGFAGVTMATVPLLVLPLAHFLVQGERMNASKLVGVTAGFVGVAILIGPAAFNTTGGQLEPIARLACFAAAACYAFGAIIARSAPKVDPIAFATAATVLAAFIIVPVAILVEGLPFEMDRNSLIAIVFLGAIPTAAANLLLVAIIRSAGPSFMSLVNYQVPLWSVLFGTVFLGEVLPNQTFATLALILLGVGFSQKNAIRRLIAGQKARA